MKPSLSFDALTLHAVVDELRAGFAGARIQKVGLLDEWTLALELYGNGERATLLISADPHAARVVVTRRRHDRAAELVTPFLLLLRKYVRDGRLDTLSQPTLERVLELQISKRDDEGSRGEVGLIIEVMGRRSNAVLVSPDGTIMDALRRASAEKNPIRPILPRRRYDAPPAQDRRSPFALDTWDHLRTLARQHPQGHVAELLGSELAGFSRLVAREAAYRATGSIASPAGDADLDRVHDAVVELLGPIRGEGGWSPCVARFEGHIVAFAPYHLTHLADQCEIVSVDSIGEAVEEAYAGREAAEANGSKPETANQMSRPLLDAIAAREKVVLRRRNALARSQEAAGDPDALRQIGQTILAYAHAIRPGQELLAVDGLEIKLEPRESASENAQRYFRDYKRARDASRRVPLLVAQADRELSHLAEMDTLVRIADDPSRIRALREELRVAGILRDREPQAARKRGKFAPKPADDGPRPITVPLPDGFLAYVGTSAKANEHITFDVAGQDDLWLHARQRPGSHVIVRTSGQKVPERVLQRAAELAAFYSQGRTDSRVAVDWTPRKFVRRIRGGPPGLVSYINEQTVDVPPRGPG
ncbi:MAG: NFACT family protein [Chloroflexi bacterium]|nr:NFACT family protein [Chloroflexota bacterium]